MTLILFTGSRDWDDWICINCVFQRLHQIFGPSTALHGGARGVDVYINGVADLWNWEVDIVTPEYPRYGRYEAPKRRNLAMLDRAPDYVVGFWDGSSTGTAHCLDWAINHYRIPTLVITNDN